jgi:hypothetical protein
VGLQVQRVRRNLDLRAWPPKELLQGVWWKRDLWTRPPKVPLQGLQSREEQLRTDLPGCPPNGHLYDLPVMGSFGLFEWGGGFAPELYAPKK